MGEFWVWYDQDEMVIRRYRIKVDALSEMAARDKVVSHYVHGDTLTREELLSRVYEKDIQTDECHFMDVARTSSWPS